MPALAVAQDARAPAPASAPLTTPASTTPADEHTANIRLHRLKHFDTKLNTEPAELKLVCRYESELSNRAPAKRIALTFDDGPQPGQTEFILETLKRHNIRATFFMIGEHAKKYPELRSSTRSGRFPRFSEVLPI